LLSFFFTVFVIVVGVQILYYNGLFAFFSFSRTPKTKQKSPSVSVLIACKNEAQNIKKNLPFILRQNYPNFEVILIDDASTDNTLEVMRFFEAQNDKIRIVSLPQTDSYTGNKKNALSKAIQVAQNEYLLFTDADCIPSSSLWIQHIANSFTANKNLVLAYGAYKKETGLLNKLIRYETLLTAWQYFSYTKLGLPYMGVGRNIAYSKSLFNQANGFEQHQHIRSGDDDLFVSQIATKSNTALCCKPSSFTISEPKSNMTDWIKQKRRHITTATSYSLSHQLSLGLFYLSQFFFIVLPLLFVITHYRLEDVLGIVVLRYLFYYVSLIPAAYKLEEKDLILYAPLLETSLVLIQMRIFVSNLLHKPQEW